MKIARHDSKDEVQYGDAPEERSPALAHLIEVFTGKGHEDIGTHFHVQVEKAPKFLEAPKAIPTETTMEKILDDILESSPLEYTNAAVAMAKLSIQKVK